MKKFLNFFRRLSFVVFFFTIAFLICNSFESSIDAAYEWNPYIGFLWHCCWCPLYIIIVALLAAVMYVISEVFIPEYEDFIERKRKEFLQSLYENPD